MEMKMFHVKHLRFYEKAPFVSGEKKIKKF